MNDGTFSLYLSIRQKQKRMIWTQSDITQTSLFAGFWIRFLSLLSPQPPPGSVPTREQQELLNAQLERIHTLFRRQLSIPLMGKALPARLWGVVLYRGEEIRLDGIACP